MIDWNFIASLEGKDVLTGYVPNPSGSRSGVTIATGVDLGRLTRAEILRLPEDVRSAIAPYIGRIGAGALLALQKKPLEITPLQAKALDAVAEAAVLGPLESAWAHDSKMRTFGELPDRAQTVLVSVAYQYGDVAERCPRFWRCMTRLDWAGAIDELKRFGDGYESRHEKEAAYLAPLINPQD